MNHCDTEDRYRISSPPYLPPKPSCRRPLRRMVTEKPCRTPEARYSQSPKCGSNISNHRNISDQPELSADENEEENSEIIDSNEEDSDNFYSQSPQTQESPRQRFSPDYRSNTPQLNSNDAIGKPHSKSPAYRNFDNSEKAENKREYCQRKSTEEIWSYRILGNICLSIVILLILSGFYFCYDIHENSNLPHQDSPLAKSDQRYQIEKFKNSMRGIRNRFPGQNRHTWGEIESGVIDVIKQRIKPWIFVLYSNETRELSCLAKLLGKASSEALLSDGSLELHHQDMGDDYGLAIDRLKPKITEKKAVVVYDLLEINPGAIQAFHTMCDREDPLVKGVVYILTINTPGNVPDYEKRIKFIEDQLTNRFINKVPEEKLQPLVTRLTDGPIIHVKSEVGLSAECRL